jgi:lipid-binding SYLF domain-containing protein
MLKATVLLSALALCLAMPVKAASDISRIDKASHPQALAAEIVEVQSHRSPGSIIIGDAIGGAVVGGLVGGGVAIYNRYGATNGTWDNWERNVLIGAGIGLGVGLIVGGIDAASNMDHTYQSFADQRSVGFAAPAGVYAKRF